MTILLELKNIKLNKHLGFPLTSKINEETGARYFVNEMDNDIIYIDKVGFLVLVTFHEAELAIIDGYYYTDGRNGTINHVIGDLYNLKLKINNDDNPAQMVIKLLMNSMYGKTITKPIETDTVVKDNQKDFEKSMSYNYDYIESVLKVDDIYYIKIVKSILSHYNYVHCGVEIVSMSKHIMNSVFDCANDCNVKMFYQDTENKSFKL